MVKKLIRASEGTDRHGQLDIANSTLRCAGFGV
jgi:hypothetical protein